MRPNAPALSKTEILRGFPLLVRETVGDGALASTSAPSWQAVKTILKNNGYHVGEGDFKKNEIRPGTEWTYGESPHGYRVVREIGPDGDVLCIFSIDGPIDDGNVDVADAIARRIAHRLGGGATAGGPASALVRIFGRLSELMANRIDQVPDKHFLAFLDSAGISLLAPKAAHVDLTFTLGDDGQEYVLVPAGAQVATLATETKPEVVFETAETLTVVANQIQRCIAFDRRDFADRTELASVVRGQPFQPFRGRSDKTPSRNRWFFLAARGLFDLTDEASHKAATVRFYFTLHEQNQPDQLAAVEVEPDPPQSNEEQLLVHVWNGNNWVPFGRGQDEDADGGSEPGVVVDETCGLSKSGEVVLSKLPSIVAVEKDAFLFSIDADFYLQSPPDRRRQTLIDTLVDAFRAHGMAVSSPLEPRLELDEVNPETGEPTVFSVKFSVPTSMADADDNEPVEHQPEREMHVDFEELVFKAERSELTYDIFADFGETALPWIRFSLPDAWERSSAITINEVHVSRTLVIEGLEPTTNDEAFAAVQASGSFVPIDVGDEFFPFGQLPAQLDTFYLRSDDAFSKPGAKISIEIGGLTGIPEAAFAGPTEDGAGNAPDIEIVDNSGPRALKIVWEYFCRNSWRLLGASTPESSISAGDVSFVDGTRAFTVDAKGSMLTVSFQIPDDDTETAFEQTRVNDVMGYWIRARIAEGSFDVQARVEVIDPEAGSYKFHPARSFAPLVTQWRLSYRDYTEGPRSFPVTLCHSSVDGMLRDHRAALATKTGFRPFAAKYEGPAFYIGLQRAMPAGTAVQVLLDVQEQQLEDSGNVMALFWEYWNGRAWIMLRVVDRSNHMTVRGYLRFTAPMDHVRSTEFGETAFWLRARPHVHRPIAVAAAKQLWPAGGTNGPADLFPVELSGSKSHPYGDPDSDDSVTGMDGGLRITSYRWRHAGADRLSSEAPIVAALAVVDQNGRQRMTTRTERRSSSRRAWRACFDPPALYASVKIESDHSAATGERYAWRLVEEKNTQGARGQVGPLLNAIWLNTVHAVNAITISDEVLGSSDSSQSLQYQLAGAPVHDRIELVVREPDHPPASELLLLQNSLRQREPDAAAILLPPEGDAGGNPWVRWHAVENFRHSDKDSRHFVLDPLSGRIIFGDGIRGRIPPAGRDNIVARRYRTQNGSDGNFPADSITVLRNPSDELADIRSVANPEPSVGGSDAEKSESVKARGPQMLRHRHRAVTRGGYSWLAMEASSEVARAQAIPHQDREGVPAPGWMSVIVVPNRPAEIAPTPSPALLRHVRDYLNDRAPVSLTQAERQQVSHVHVRGPEYISVSVAARVVAAWGWNADSVKMAIIERLSEYLNPLRGGPQRTGWQFGRDAYLAEVIAEIEAVHGVDFVSNVLLKGTISQRALQVSHQPYAHTHRTIPSGSIVASFDGRTRLILADPIVDAEMNNSTLTLQVHGLKTGDRVALVAPDDTILIRDLTSVSVEKLEENDVEAGVIRRTVSLLTGPTWAQPEKLGDLSQLPTGLMSLDGRIRLPLDEDELTPDVSLEPDSDNIVKLTILEPDKDALVEVLATDRREPLLSSLDVEDIWRPSNRIIIPANHLVSKGDLVVEVRTG